LLKNLLAAGKKTVGFLLLLAHRLNITNQTPGLANLGPQALVLGQHSLIPFLVLLVLVRLLEVGQVLLVVLEGHFQVILQVLDLLLHRTLLGGELLHGLVKALAFRLKFVLSLSLQTLDLLIIIIIIIFFYFWG